MDVLRHVLFLSFITAFQLIPYSFYSSYNASGAVVEWLEQLGYGAESRRIA